MTELADLLLRNGTVVTMDGAGRVFAPGVVVIRGDSILAVGGSELQHNYQAAEVVDCASHIVMPGLINAHAHLPMTLLRGLIDDLRLDVWLYGYMMPVERRFVTPDFCYLGTQLACLEMIRGGVTCFADMYYFEDRVACAAADAGMRGICGQTVLKFPSPDATNYDESLAECRRFLQTWADHPLIVPSVAPHAPYTCTLEIFQEATRLAREFGTPILTHLCETSGEVEDWIRDYGCSPVQWVEEHGVLSAKVVAAHCVHVDDADMRILERAGCGVAHNPTSNLKLASGVAPVVRMQELGIPVGIGTDGCASNNDQDMFEETRLAALLPKGIALDPTLLPARTAISMATVEGARALHMESLTGSLEAGKRADVIVVGMAQPHAVPRFELSESNLYAHLAYAAKSHDVRDTIINGRVVMRERRVVTLDEAAILREAQSYAVNITSFVVERDRNLLDKLVALGEIGREEVFEVQVKVRISDRDRLEAELRTTPAFTITKHTLRRQYDTYFLFATREQGRIRYREDNVMAPLAEQAAGWECRLSIAPTYRLTWIGPGNEREYHNSVILTRSRYDATASRSLRFYREYFQATRIVEIAKERRRYRGLYQGLEFAFNIDRLEAPAGDYLEIKSRTWSAKDAMHKAELISEILELLRLKEADLVRGEYLHIVAPDWHEQSS